MNMFFHKTGIMNKIFVLLFSVTIITAGDSDDDKSDDYDAYEYNDVGTRPADAYEFNYVEDRQAVAPNIDIPNPEDGLPDAPNIDIPNPEDGLPDIEGPPYRISDTVSEEVFLAYPHCWKQMKQFCSMREPLAVDFAIAVLRQWKMGFVFMSRYLIGYYNEIAPHLDNDSILAPNEYCAVIFGISIEELPRNEVEITITGETPSNEGEVFNNIQRNEDPEVKRCLSELSPFGVTREAALHHAFYEKARTDLDKFSATDFDSFVREVARLSLVNHIDFTDEYMLFMADNVQLKENTGTMKRPLTFCKHLEREEMSHLYHHNV